ncbi:MAG: DUF2061 domain-containing protein [Planctomycetes bacterium]|nr:DUF2061 domain-containing protein [Planctomycetota bacterium]
MPGGKNYINDTHVRSIVKGIVWRLLASLATVIIVYAFTRELTIAIEVGGVEILAKLLLYYGHERLWNLIKWGRSSQVMEPKT